MQDEKKKTQFPLSIVIESETIHARFF